MIVVMASIGAVASIAASPTLGIQLAFLAATILGVASLLVALARRVLNPAWVVVVTVYLIDPVGALVRDFGFPVAMIVVAAIAPLPFVLTALWQYPDARARLKWFLPLACLVGFAALSIAWSPDPVYGIRKLSVWAIAGLIPCASVLVLASRSRPASWKVITTAALVYAVTLLVIGVTTFYPGRLTFFDSNPIWEARAIFVGAIVTLFAPSPLVVKVVAVPILLVAGYQTDSLGPTVGLVVGIFAGVSEKLRSADLSDRRVQAGWAALVVAVGLGVAVFLGGALGSDQAYLSPVLGDPNVTSRALYLEAAGQLFLDSPIVGNGFGAFAATGLWEYPHNIVAEVASELGLVGLIALAAWVALAVRGAARSPLLMSLVAATSVFALFSGSVSGNTEFWLFTGLAVASTPLRQGLSAARERML